MALPNIGSATCFPLWSFLDENPLARKSKDVVFAVAFDLVGDRRLDRTFFLS